MPHLRACSRSWTVGSDDFVFTGLRWFCMNAVFAVALPIVFRLGHEDCGRNIAEYIVTAFCVHCLMALACLFLVYQSSKGSVFETAKRRLVPFALLLCLVCSVVIAGVAVWGVLLYFKHDACGDHDEDRKWVLATAICQLIILAAVLCNLAVSYDSIDSMGNPSDGEETFESYKKLWFRRCSCFFFCIGTEEEAVMNVATIMSGVFAGLDLVSSDLSAGIVLLRAKQISMIKQAQRAAGLRTNKDEMVGHTDIKLSHGARPIPIASEELNDDVRTLHLYGKYFMAAYGWPLHCFAHPCTGVPTMCGACCLGLPPTKRGKQVVIENDCCKCNTAAFFAETKVRQEYVKYMSWVSEVECPAFYLCVDDELKSIILGIRGTLSLADCLTDAQADIIPFGEHLAPNGTAHKGIATAAIKIQKRIAELGILEEEIKRNADYKFVVLGHSLGAGTAALLAVLLKKQYSELLCLAYAVPGGLMNLELSKATRDFVIGTAVGQDLVPRASLPTVYNARNRMLEAMSQSHKAKCQVLGCCCCFSNDSQHNNFFRINDNTATDRETPPEALPILSAADEPGRVLSAFLSSLRAIDPRVPTHAMYPPARFVHLMRVGQKKGKLLYFPVYRDVVEMMDEGILMSVRMVTDHFPDLMLDVLEKVVEPQKREPLGGWGMDARPYRNPMRLYEEYLNNGEQGETEDAVTTRPENPVNVSDVTLVETTPDSAPAESSEQPVVE